MEKVIAYNFEHTITPKQDWHNFYHTRRDSNFAAVFQLDNGEHLAIRDHLGVCPLYYKLDRPNHVRFSFCFNDLLTNGKPPSSEAINHYLAFPTAKVTKLFEDIHCIPPGSVIKIHADGSTTTLYTYKMTTGQIHISRAHAADELERLLYQAVERVIVSDRAGIYLSGGMDSGLMGKILSDKAVTLDAYTALPWGKAGTEYVFAQTNNAIVGTRQSNYVDVQPSKYGKYITSLPKLYKTPHGTTTALNIAALWQETDIASQPQLYFAQNTDTFTSSVAAQVNAIVMSNLPKFVRSKFTDMPFDDLLKNYLYHCSHGRITEHDFSNFIDTKARQLTQIAQAGMYIGHTQADSEAINAPSIANNQLCSNPYYDMDLIEFYLALPTRFKIKLNRKTKTFISFEKQLLREIAMRHLPKKLVARKKGFVLPTERNEQGLRFFEELSDVYHDTKANNRFERLSLHILEKHIG